MSTRLTLFAFFRQFSWYSSGNNVGTGTRVREHFFLMMYMVQGWRILCDFITWTDVRSSSLIRIHIASVILKALVLFFQLRDISKVSLFHNVNKKWFTWSCIGYYLNPLKKMQNSSIFFSISAKMRLHGRKLFPLHKNFCSTSVKYPHLTICCNYFEIIILSQTPIRLAV